MTLSHFARRLLVGNREHSRVEPGFFHLDACLEFESDLAAVHVCIVRVDLEHGREHLLCHFVEVLDNREAKTAQLILSHLRCLTSVVFAVAGGPHRGIDEGYHGQIFAECGQGWDRQRECFFVHDASHRLDIVLHGNRELFQVEVAKGRCPLIGAGTEGAHRAQLS